jgi:hypothetical protein
MIFTIHPDQLGNKHLRAVRRALQSHAPFLMGEWTGVLRYLPDLVYLELHEHGEPEKTTPDATWAAFGDRPAGVIAGWLIGQLWRHWED